MNTRDVYSKSNDVFDRLRATLLGLEKANAVPRDDLLSAPMSVKIYIIWNKKYIGHILIFFF